MTTNEKDPAGKLRVPSTEQQTNDTKIPSKKRRVLSALIEGKSFNRFESERKLNDHCLPSTVSDLQALGITIDRQLETVPGFCGLPAHVCRYWIAQEHRARAKKVLEGLR